MFIEKVIRTPWNQREAYLSSFGIISPYQKQCEVLKTRLEEKGWRGIEVGSAETFQGKEKDIIIISSVRRGFIGFLKDEKVRMKKI